VARARRRYAKGNNAWGECAKSGQRTLLKNLVRDGDNPNLLVLPSEYDPPHPQEKPLNAFDPQTLRYPSPKRDKIGATVAIGTLYNVAKGTFELEPYAIGYAGLIQATGGIVASPTPDNSRVTASGDVRVTSDGSTRVTNG